MKDGKVKGLVVTHKHLDHIRGADIIMQRENVKIDALIINHDYSHATIAVRNLLASAQDKKLFSINCNKPFVINEGLTTITVHNPTQITNNRNSCPDINNSSISICIRLGTDSVVLTGDVSNNTLLQSYMCLRGCESTTRLLKVSHHGSHTGTNDDMLKKFNPDFAFISAGESKKYKHPHPDTIELLKVHNVPSIISKTHKRDVCYEITGNGIHQHDDVSQLEQMTLFCNNPEPEVKECWFQNILKAEAKTCTPPKCSNTVADKI